MLRQELVDVLNAYLSSENSLYDCYDWIVGLSWDDPEFLSDQRLKESIGALELLSIEYLEDMRPESEFREEAALTVRAFSNAFQVAVFTASESTDTYWGPTDHPSIPSEYFQVATSMASAPA